MSHCEQKAPAGPAAKKEAKDEFYSGTTTHGSLSAASGGNNSEELQTQAH